MAFRKEIAIALLMALLLCGVWMIVSKVETSNDGAQTKFVTDAVRNAALTCYAVEGAYPESLDYLRSNYGLAYDENRYFVSYRVEFGSTRMPVTDVIDLEAD